MTPGQQQRIDSSRLGAALESAGLTGAKLAEELGVSRGLVSHWTTGRRECPAKYTGEISRLLQVDRGWLLGADKGGPATRSGESSKEKRVMAAKTKGVTDSLEDAEWTFRKAPEDGGRDYGSANIWAIPAGIATLVREVGQNSLDHPAKSRTGIHMRYRIVELTEDGPAYRPFMDALRFYALREHIQEASLTRSRLATRLRSGLDRVERRDRLILLRIDDFGTTGLYGNETTGGRHETNPFAALVRNNLDSSKESTTAGGSFGLGKAVLWRCSDLSTVLFASDIMPELRPQGRSAGCRFMGKAELTWHGFAEDAFAGPGWLGKGSPPESMWVGNEELAALELSRAELPSTVDPSRAWGTSILIVGFRDPQSEEVVDSAAVLQMIAKAAAVNFWPSMMRDRFRVSLERLVDGDLKEEIREVNPIDYVPELCEAIVRHDGDEVEEVLEEQGDVVRATITHRVPQTGRGASDLVSFPDDLDAQGYLLVRLAEDGSRDEGHLNTVALVRGREMVVKYWRRTNIVVGGRPFHAVLLAGEAAGSESPQVAADQFLRLAEPPAHDDWRYNDEIREKFAWGARSRLHELFDAVTERLRTIIRPTGTGKDEGPRELKRLLQLSVPGPSDPIPATLRRVRAELVDGAWEVEGEIHINERSKSWDISPRLRIDTESGTRPRLPWRSLELVDVARGKARAIDSKIRVEPKTRRIRFRAVSEPESDGVVAARCRAKLDLRIERVTT